MIAKQIHEFNIKAMAKSHDKVLSAFIGLSNDIRYDTPKDTGRLRNNWFPSVNSGSNETTESTSDQVMARVEALRFKLGDTLYLTNNLPYAEVIEFGLYPNPPKNGTGKTVNGYSTKSPAGMCRKNIIKWEKYFNA